MSKTSSISPLKAVDVRLINCTLTGTHICLEPVTPAHCEEMRTALDCDQADWDIQRACARGAHFAEYWEKMPQVPGRHAFAARLADRG